MLQRDEEAAHSRRVAALCRRAGALIPFPDSVTQALDTAGAAHQIWSPVVRENEWAVLLRKLFPQDPAPANPALSWRILAARAEPSARTNSDSERVTRLAADVLSACDALDEAVEFAALDRDTAAGAIAEFHRDTGPAYPRPVRQALARATLSDSGARRYEHLPVLPKAANKLMRTSDENTSPAELSQLAAADPVLCARLLQVANSARFGGRQSVTRITDAAARLGVPLARKVLLSACFAPLFASRPLQDLWRHSQQVAAAAAEAARSVSFDPDLAYTAGLLHDIGRLVFETGSAASQTTLGKWRDDGFALTYAETLTYGKDHGAAGAEVLRQWELPRVLIEAVAHHHQPEMSESPLASLLFLAEEWTALRTGTPSEGMAVPLRGAHARQATGLTAGIAPDWEAASDLLALAG